MLRTDRGLELGEVLTRLAVPPSTGSGSTGVARGREGRGPARSSEPAHDQPAVLRTAGPEDLERARRSEALRREQFTVCRRILEDGGWPVDLLDVEPLLDLSTTVLHVLGPPDVDLALLRAGFRSLSAFDVVFESDRLGIRTRRRGGHRPGRGELGTMRRLRLLRRRVRIAGRQHLLRAGGSGDGSLRVQHPRSSRFRVLQLRGFEMAGREAAGRG